MKPTDAAEEEELWDILTPDEETALVVIREARAEMASLRIEPTFEALVALLVRAGVAEAGIGGPGRRFRLGGARFAIRFDPRDSTLIDVSFG